MFSNVSIAPSRSRRAARAARGWDFPWCIPSSRRTAATIDGRKPRKPGCHISRPASAARLAAWHARANARPPPRSGCTSPGEDEAILILATDLSHPAAGRLRWMRILLVEDEEKVARFVARGLKAERYAVDIAADGNSGLDDVRACSYDLIILDLNLPGHFGNGVAQAHPQASSARPGAHSCPRATTSRTRSPISRKAPTII